jgi:hypothetical protein
MNRILQWFRGLFQKFFDLFLGAYAYDKAKRIAWVAFALTIFAALYTGVTAILSGIGAAMPTPVQIAASWVVPANLNECVTAFFGAKLALYIYEYKMHISVKYIQ